MQSTRNRLFFFGGFVLQLGLFFHFYRLNLLYAKPTEYLLLVSSFILFLAYATNIDDIKKSIKKINKEPLIFAILIFGFVLFSTCIGFFSHNLLFDVPGFRLLLKLILNIFIFISVIALINHNQTLIKNLAILFWVSFIVYVPFTWGANDFAYFGINLVEPVSGRFRGFTEGPGATAFSLNESLPILLSFYFFVENKYIKAGLIFPLIFLGLILLWCGSRIALISTSISLIYLIFFIVLFKKVQVKNFLYFLILFFSCLYFISHYIDIPQIIHMLAGRLIGVGPAELATKIKNTSDFLNLTLSGVSDPNINIRITSFKYYFNLVMDNPLGLGLNYFPTMAFFDDLICFNYCPPDSILDTFVHGGIGLFITMVLFSRKIIVVFFSKITSLFKNNSRFAFLYLGFSAAFISDLIVTLFGGFPIYSLKFWIISAIAFALPYSERLKK